MKKLYEIGGALFGAAALITQFAVSVPAFEAKGMSLLGGIVNFFSFFTILTNIAVVIFYLANLFSPKAPSPKWQAAMALYIAIVACVYIAVLQDIWEPQGIFKVLDVSLHYITPALFVLYWLIFVPKGQTTYRNAWAWLVPGLAYVIYVLVRGAAIGLYPYPFLDAGAVGYARVAINISVLLGFFGVLSLLVIALDRRLAAYK